MKTLTTLILALSLGACGSTVYNIDIHPDAFKVADELTVNPGQGGDDSSSTAGAPTSGGTDASPGGSNLIRGHGQQGVIIQIGTSAKPTTTNDVTADLPTGP